MDLYKIIEKHILKYGGNYYTTYNIKVNIINVSKLPEKLHYLSICNTFNMVKFKTTLHDNFIELNLTQNKKLIVINVVINRNLETLRLDDTNVKKLKLNLAPRFIIYDSENIKNSKTIRKSSFYRW